MSMVDPSIDYLAEKVDSKYTLVILAAKRARELTVGNQNMPQKEVSTALRGDRKSTRLNSSHITITYAVFC